MRTLLEGDRLLSGGSAEGTAGQHHRYRSTAPVTTPGPFPCCLTCLDGTGVPSSSNRQNPLQFQLPCCWVTRSLCSATSLSFGQKSKGGSSSIRAGRGGGGGDCAKAQGELEPEPEPEPGERGGGWCSVWLQWPLSQEGKGSSSQKLSLLGRMTLSWGRMCLSLANEWTGGQAGTAWSQEASR